MAQAPRKSRRKKPQAAQETPAPVTPEAKPLPRTVEELLDHTVAPGDPFVQAAFDRASKTSAPLGGASVGTDGPDSLLVQRRTRRSRVMSFEVHGIVWKAGFTKELSQTPLGATLGLTELPGGDGATGGAIIRMIDSGLEAVLHELPPAALLEACELMYGRTRVLQQLALYYLPREGAALTGAIAVYGDGPTSRRHCLFLQTAIKRPDPRVLDQMLATFQAALPLQQAAPLQGPPPDFWKELERSWFEVRATYRTSALGQGSEKVKQQVTQQFDQTTRQIDRAIVAMDRAGDRLVRANLGSRFLIGLTHGITGSLNGFIRLTDSLLGRRRR